jgi:homogentisate 1,2-dioxygenase
MANVIVGLKQNRGQALRSGSPFSVFIEGQRGSWGFRTRPAAEEFKKRLESGENASSAYGAAIKLDETLGASSKQIRENARGFVAGIPVIVTSKTDRSGEIGVSYQDGRKDKLDFVRADRFIPQQRRTRL